MPKTQTPTRKLADLTSLDLLDQPYTLWQLRPLTADQFGRLAQDRGLHFFSRQLEGLHRLKLLPPLFRVQRDGRLIASMARNKEPGVWETAHWQPTARHDLLEARAEGRLHDPARDHFIARKRLEREVAGVPYRSSEYLYSHHQVLMLPMIRNVLPELTYDSQGVKGLDVLLVQREIWQKRAIELRRLVLVLSVLEPIYYPSVRGRIRYSHEGELDAYETWRRRLAVQAMIKWLGIDAEWLKSSAQALLRDADGFDPLGRWLDVVRAANPEQWELLEGTARSAIDLRIAAEMLLLQYERLARGRLAPKLPEPSGRFQREFASRLKPQVSLDKVLTDFGLSPHPRVVLVVEGETELMLFPRALAFYGVRRDSDFIAIENAEGVGRDISSLVAYAVAPRTEHDEERDYLRLLRPPTKLLVMMDAEGHYLTKADRAKRRETWIDRIMRTFPRKHQKPPVRRSIEPLVSVGTWNRKGENFEFAHFTDRQLATAIWQVSGDRQPMTQAKLVDVVGQLRRKQGNLKRVLAGASKLALADALWPVLERRMEQARRHKTERRIPIVRAIDRVIELAQGPRRNYVIPLKRDR